MGGLPHSEICGSKVAHTSPQLIAACHVLHRLCMPRHPPYALTSRLRVHTTNDSAASALVRGRGSISQPLIKTIRTASNTQLSPKAEQGETNAGPRHRFRKNPFTMSKRGGILPKSAPHHSGTARNCNRSSWRLVEPVGIEPTTSSLQS